MLLLASSREVLHGHNLYLPTVQLDLNFKNTRVCNCTRTARALKYSLRARERTGD